MLKTISFSELNLKRRQIVEVRLTPSQAAELLKHNTDNRRMRRNLVKYLIAQIHQEEWRDDHPQPIVFSGERLIDGQHRLTAIAQSKHEEGCVVRIETGADDKVREYLDTGAPRSLADRVSVVDDRSYNEWIMRLVSSTADCTNVTTKRATPEDAREFYDSRRKSIDAIRACWKKVPLLSVYPILVAAVEYAEKDIAKACEFYNDYFTAAGCINQAQILRDAVLRSGSGNRGCTQRKELYQKAVACMKAHRDDKEIKRAVCGSW